MQISVLPGTLWQKINASITNTVDTMYLDQLVEESRKIKEKGQMQTLGCYGQEAAEYEENNLYG